MSEYLDSIAQFLQREDDVLLYTPDPSPNEPARASHRRWFGHYILEGHTPRMEEDIFAWARWYEHADRTVAATQVSPEVEVWTIFLGLDSGLGQAGPPILFETRIFGGVRAGEQWRYATWDEAAAGHRAAVESLCLSA